MPLRPMGGSAITTGDGGEVDGDGMVASGVVDADGGMAMSGKGGA